MDGAPTGSGVRQHTVSNYKKKGAMDQRKLNGGNNSK